MIHPQKNKINDKAYAGKYLGSISFGFTVILFCDQFILLERKLPILKSVSTVLENGIGFICFNSSYFNIIIERLLNAATSLLGN